jgi:hypothetical protein
MLLSSLQPEFFNTLLGVQFNGWIVEHGATLMRTFLEGSFSAEGRQLAGTVSRVRYCVQALARIVALLVIAALRHSRQISSRYNLQAVMKRTAPSVNKMMG